MEEIICLSILDVKVNGGSVEKIASLKGINSETKGTVDSLILFQKDAPCHQIKLKEKLESLISTHPRSLLHGERSRKVEIEIPSIHMTRLVFPSWNSATSSKLQSVMYRTEDARSLKESYMGEEDGGRRGSMLIEK